MSKESPKPKRGRRTKAEIEQEFNFIAQEETEALKFTTSKAKEIDHLQEEEILEAVKGLTSEVMIRKFADLNIEISKTLSSLSEKIVSEIQILSNLRQAVEVEKREIERLHNIDVVQTSLHHLLEEYHLRKRQFEEEIVQQKTNWELEKEQKIREDQEEADQLTKARKREVDEYEYKRNLERKKAQDKHEEEMRLDNKLNKEKQESLEKSWQQREEALKAKEDEYLSSKKKVEEYPFQLQREVEKAVAEAIRHTENQLAHEMELLKRDNESEKRIAELKIKTLEDALARQLAQSTSMQGQVDEAKKQVQDIAVKAIEGASGAKAFQIALEQSKSRPASV